MRFHRLNPSRPTAVLLLTLVLVASACSQDDGQTGGETTTANTQAEATSDGEGGSTSDEPFAGTTLNLLYFELPYLEGIQQQLPEFTEETGIEVNIETLSEQAAVEKAQLELASGAGNYDVVGIQSGNMPLYAQNDWVIPIEEYYDSDVADPDRLAQDDFLDTTMEALADDGQQQCLPFFAATVIMYYRIDLFEDAGITDPPTTYDELIEAAETVQTDDIPALAIRSAPASAAGNLWIWNQFLYGNGGDYFADFPNDLTPTLDSPEATTALQQWVELKQNYAPEGAVNYTYDDVVIAMQQGRVAMAIEGAPLAGQILDPEASRVVDKLGFAVVPGGPTGPKPSFVSHGLCIAADSPNADAAYTFIEWAMSPQTMNQVALDTSHLAVTRTSVWEDQDFIDKYDYDFGSGSFLDAYRESLEAAPADYYPPFAAWAQINELVGLEIQKAEIGEVSPEQALGNANQAVAQALRDAGLLE